jgi:hypothetical protein
MWVLKNEISKQFFTGWNELKAAIETTDSKVYAAHFPSWDAAVSAKKGILSNNWKPILRDEA